MGHGVRTCVQMAGGVMLLSLKGQCHCCRPEID